MDQTPAQRQLYSVNQLAGELGITARAIRFYEERGLIAPRRAGPNRVLDRRDRARLMLVLRGKRLGFSLSEIREYLDLYEAGRSQVRQLQKLLDLTRQRMAELEKQRGDLDLTISELRSIERQSAEALAAAAAKEAP